jgi:hypothetical protein
MHEAKTVPLLLLLLLHHHLLPFFESAINSCPNIMLWEYYSAPYRRWGRLVGRLLGCWMPVLAAGGYAIHLNGSLNEGNSLPPSPTYTSQPASQPEQPDVGIEIEMSV